MFPRVTFLCLITVIGVTIVTAQTSGPVEVSTPVDIKMQSKALVAMIRSLVMEAKEGTSLDRLHQNIQDLQKFASGLLTQLPGEVSECNTQAIIKMAAAGTGSHEVLHVLLAKDSLSVLSARLDLCLAMMSQIAQQYEGELTLSSDVSPYLAALMFATNTTTNVIETADIHRLAELSHTCCYKNYLHATDFFSIEELLSAPFLVADKAVKKVALPPHSSHLGVNRVRRQFNLGLGGGWSLGLGGVSWQSSSGNTQFNVQPTFSGFKPDGFSAGLTFHF